jgi:hypothetical protein
MKRFDQLNGKIDDFLIKKKIKKKPQTDFEKHLHLFIQSFLLNLGCDMTLEDALKRSILYSSDDEQMIRVLKVHQNSVDALNQYAIACDSQSLWRFSRLVNQCYHTGGTQLYASLERFHDELWTEKLSEVKRHSEKVSVQLTFLLTLSLISVIIVVVAPIMRML